MQYSMKDNRQEVQNKNDVQFYVHSAGNSWLCVLLYSYLNITSSGTSNSTCSDMQTQGKDCNSFFFC